MAEIKPPIPKEYHLVEQLNRVADFTTRSLSHPDFYDRLLPELAQTLQDVDLPRDHRQTMFRNFETLREMRPQMTEGEIVTFQEEQQQQYIEHVVTALAVLNNAGINIQHFEVFKDNQPEPIKQGKILSRRRFLKIATMFGAGTVLSLYFDRDNLLNIAKTYLTKPADIYPDSQVYEPMNHESGTYLKEELAKMYERELDDFQKKVLPMDRWTEILDEHMTLAEPFYERWKEKQAVDTQTPTIDRFFVNEYLPAFFTECDEQKMDKVLLVLAARKDAWAMGDVEGQRMDLQDQRHQALAAAAEGDDSFIGKSLLGIMGIDTPQKLQEKLVSPSRRDLMTLFLSSQRGKSSYVSGEDNGMDLFQIARVYLASGTHTDTEVNTNARTVIHNSRYQEFKTAYPTLAAAYEQMDSVQQQARELKQQLSTKMSEWDNKFSVYCDVFFTGDVKKRDQAWEAIGYDPKQPEKFVPHIFTFSRAWEAAYYSGFLDVNAMAAQAIKVVRSNFENEFVDDKQDTRSYFFQDQIDLMDPEGKLTFINYMKTVLDNEATLGDNSLFDRDQQSMKPYIPSVAVSIDRAHYQEQAEQAKTLLRDIEANVQQILALEKPTLRSVAAIFPEAAKVESDMNFQIFSRVAYYKWMSQEADSALQWTDDKQRQIFHPIADYMKPGTSEALARTEAMSSVIKPEDAYRISLFLNLMVESSHRNISASRGLTRGTGEECMKRFALDAPINGKDVSKHLTELLRKLVSSQDADAIYAGSEESPVLSLGLDPALSSLRDSLPSDNLFEADGTLKPEYVDTLAYVLIEAVSKPDEYQWELYKDEFAKFQTNANWVQTPGINIAFEEIKKLIHPKPDGNLPKPEWRNKHLVAGKDIIDSLRTRPEEYFLEGLVGEPDVVLSSKELFDAPEGTIQNGMVKNNTLIYDLLTDIRYDYLINLHSDTTSDQDIWASFNPTDNPNMSYWFYSINHEKTTDKIYVVDIYQGIRESKTCREVIQVKYKLVDGYYLFMVTRKDPVEGKNTDQYIDFSIDINGDSGKSHFLNAIVNSPSE